MAEPEQLAPRQPRKDPKTNRVVAPTTAFDQAAGQLKVQPLPTAEQMLGLSDGELSAILERFGITKSWAQMHNDAANYVSQMSNISPSEKDAFDAEVARLTTQGERRGLLGLVRRTQENYTTNRMVTGDPNQEFIRILDSHDNNCDSCIELAGTVGTMAEHIAQGLPGAASCYGGDYCRCQLFVIE